MHIRNVDRYQFFYSNQWVPLSSRVRAIETTGPMAQSIDESVKSIEIISIGSSDDSHEEVVETLSKAEKNEEKGNEEQSNEKEPQNKQPPTVNAVPDNPRSVSENEQESQGLLEESMNVPPIMRPNLQNVDDKMVVVGQEPLPADVDNDADELVQLRGEGRYFGTASEVLGPVCRNCHERGHIAAQCKVVICESCGERNNHYTRHCPKLQKCTNCGEMGHLRAQCTSRSKIIFCNRCESRNHTSDHCPDIWRCYKLSKNLKPHYPASISCYNCASKGHYGDECREARPVELRYIDKSAFTGKNLAPHLLDIYQEKVRHDPPRRLRSLYNLNSNRQSYDRHDCRETQSIADEKGGKLKRKLKEVGGQAKGMLKKRKF